jgi:high affinity Mn2+ porin
MHTPPSRTPPPRPLAVSVLTTLAALAPLAAARAQERDPPRLIPQLLGAQFTLIAQHLAPFTAAYSGPNSLPAAGDNEATHTYGVYLGSQITARLQAYFDVEMARGAGIGNAVGLNGITDGDVIRQGSVDLGQGPYVARAFLRYTLRFTSSSDTVGRGMDQLPGAVPTGHLELAVGKLAASDVFDLNRYANTTRGQFCNWGLFNNTAWDYAADTRGYTWGVAVNWSHPRWSLAVGSFLMPSFANGNIFDRDYPRARGDNMQLTLQPDARGTVIRLLAYANHARMGDYAEALARAQASGQTPNIVADDRPGRAKYGVGANIERPLGDSGETGVFVRAGWNDGHAEDFAFTEADRHLSAGLQLAGTRWGRAHDRLGIAAVRHGLSAEHRAYLAAGGKGFLLGDGRLDYGGETIFETYYGMQLNPHATVSPDVQFIVHPGCNRARGPATVLTLRLNLHS